MFKDMILSFLSNLKAYLNKDKLSYTINQLRTQY